MLDIRFPDWAITDRQAGQTLIFGLYDGKVYIRVRGRSGDKNAPPLFLKKLERANVFRKFRKLAEKALTCPPETKLSIQFTSFDMQSKQSKLVWVFVIEKDSKMCYRMHLTDAQNGGRTYTFALNGSRSVQIGSDPMSDSDRSADMLQDFIDWFQEVQIWYVATIKPYDPNAAQQRRGGGNRGGFSRGGGGGGGYRPPQGGNQPPASGGESVGIGSDMSDLPF